MTLIIYIVKRIQKGSICESDARAGGGSPPRRVLGVAGTLFSGRGFDGIRVADFMKGACLKHGASTATSPRKALGRGQTCARVLGRAGWAGRLAGTPHPSFEAVVRGYLSLRHCDDPGHGCPFAALGSDAVQQPLTRFGTQGSVLQIPFAPTNFYGSLKKQRYP